MEEYIYLVDEKRKEVYSTLPKELNHKYESCRVENETFLLNGKKYRHGIKINPNGIAYFVTSNREVVERPRLFKEKLESFLDFVPFIKKIKTSMKAKAETRSKRIIHNLRTLNAYNIQELYNLIPEDELLRVKKEERKGFIEKKVKEQMTKIPGMLMNIMKNSFGISTEFIVSEKIYGTNQKPKRDKHPVRRALMSILYLSSHSFYEKEIVIDVDDSTQEIMMDYGIFQVVITQLMDNALKYAKPQSTINISFSVEDNCFCISIHMLSLYIGDKELKQLTNEGFCGEEAKRVKKNGKGIGMFLVKRVLELERAKIDVSNGGAKIVSGDGVSYSNNKFTIKYPKSLMIK
jgi:hypothetical protein